MVIMLVVFVNVTSNILMTALLTFSIPTAAQQLHPLVIMLVIMHTQYIGGWVTSIVYMPLSIFIQT